MALNQDGHLDLFVTNNAWQRWEWRGGLLHDLPLESGEIHDPTLVLVPEPDASGGALVLLFLRIAGKVSLHGCGQPTPSVGLPIQ